MENKSKFLDLQTDPCKIVEPEEKPIDRVCPTCIPDPNYTPPEWWKETEPWLNEQTCEYSVAMFVNEEGESFQLSDLKTLFEEAQDFDIPSSGIPSPAPTTGLAKELKIDREKKRTKNQEQLEKIKRSFIKPGIRALLRHFEKKETDEYVCAKNDCSILDRSDAENLSRQIKHFASTNSNVSFTEWLRAEENVGSSLEPIDNPNALEIYANAPDHYFYGMANGAMGVLVTVPAHIFDQVPPAPIPDEIDTDIEEVTFKAPEFSAWIAKMESVFVLFSKFQSYFNHTESGKLYQLIEGEETPFYAKFYQGRFEAFESALSQFLEQKGYEYNNFFNRLVAYNTSKTVEEITLTFDKSDETKPFKLADTMKIKTPGCTEITLKLPPEPNDTLLVHGDDIRRTAFRDQTLMSYIANYDKLKTEIDAKEPPPWLDFLVENTYPQISVDYGDNSIEGKTDALGCLLDKFAGLDDYILNEAMSFWDSFVYQYNKNRCREFKNRDKKKPNIYNEGKQLKALEKAEKEQRRRYLKKKGILEDKKVKKTNKKSKVDDNGLKELMSKFNPCNWRKITLKAVQCLLSGMTLEEGYRQIIKASLGAVTTEGMELLLAGLPADKQALVREKIQSEFKDLPAPWEVGYDPGDVESVYDRTAQENLEKQATAGMEYDNLNALIERKSTELEKRITEGSNYDKYKQEKEKEFDRLLKALARAEQNLTTATNSFNEAQKLYDSNLELYRQMELLYEAAVARNFSEDSILEKRNTADAAKKRSDASKVYLDRTQTNLTNKTRERNIARTNEQLGRGLVPRESYEAEWHAENKRLEEEINKMATELPAAKERSLQAMKESPNAIGFSDLNETQQEIVIKQEKEKLTFVQAGKGDKIRQGTYGRAVGNVQKELMGAYADAILENASIQEIRDGIDALPGAKIIGEFFTSLSCPSYQFATPPLDEFLGTFTIGACGKGKTRPFVLPDLKIIPGGWSIWPPLKEAFIFAFKKSMSQVISALILKSIQTLEAGICQALTFASEGTQDLVEASLNGGRFPRSFAEIVSDVICADELDEDEQAKAQEQLFAMTGAPQRGSTTPQEVLETMSTLGSENDYLKAMTGNADPNFLENVSRTLALVHPDYPSLGTSNGLDEMLTNAGNALTEEQRDNALAIALRPVPFTPLDSSICLTNEQAEEYYNTLKDVFANQLGDPDIADKFINDQRDKAKSDLADVADILVKGPEGKLQEAIDGLFADPDPDCDVDNSLLQTPEELQAQIDALTTGIFARLHRAFIDDTIEENIGERFWSAGLGDSMGILLMITADSVGYNYAKHMRVRNELFFRFLSVCGFFDNEAPFPETIAEQMRQYLLDSVPATEEKYAYSEDSKIYLEYENGFIDYERYKSEMFIKEAIKNSIADSTYHISNFDYQFQVVAKTGKKGDIETIRNFIVEKPLSEKEDKFVKQYAPSQEQLIFLPLPTIGDASITGPNTFRNYVMKNYMEFKIGKIADVDIPLRSAAEIVTNLNNLLLNDLKPKILSSEVSDSPSSSQFLPPSNGFLHGGAGERVITVDDLTYVDPEPGSLEYTYDNDDGVLGKSLTDNPRVKFLDPLKHGGTFESPYIYIEPELSYGFLSFVKVIVPSIDGCEPRNTNFLELKKLEDGIGEKENKITRNEKLSESPECLVEVPFDKVSSPATLATLEQIVTATIRVFLTEFMINTFSIHGNLALNDNNYEELIYEYISSKMQQSLSSEYALFAVTYEGYTYWLLFLEQCAQIYNRKLQLGEVQADPEIQAAMDTINQVQIKYTKPKRDSGALFENDFIINKSNIPKTIKEFLDIAKSQFDDVYAYPAVGGYLVSQNTRRWNKTLDPEKFDEIEGEPEDSFRIMRGGLDTALGIPLGGFRYWTQSQMNFSAKIATIAEYESTAMVFLKRLIKEQLQMYSKKLSSELQPRPLIYDINKYFIGGSRCFLGSQIRAGIYDVEVPIGGASGVDMGVQSSTEHYGTINHCAKSNGTDALQLMGLDEFGMEKVGRIGGLYLEKYLKIIPKIRTNPVTGLKEAPTREQNKAMLTAQRPTNLPEGMFNINEFIDFLRAQNIPDHVNISDWFGNAKISESSKQGYDGSIGIRFGVRLCYATNKDFVSSLDISNIDSVVQKSREQRAFLLSKDSETAFIPLASYEKDILDEKLISFKSSDVTDDFNQDIKCFIDGLVKTEEFNLVFNNILNVRKIGSLLACYSDVNFLASIGLGEGERRDPDLGIINVLNLGIEDIPNDRDRSNTFNDCKSECRKLFVSNYKRNDFDPPNEEEGVDNLSLATQKALAKTYAALSLDPEVSWWVRRRIKPTKPTDKEGKECQNQFGSLFNIKR